MMSYSVSGQYSITKTSQIPKLWSQTEKAQIYIYMYFRLVELTPGLALRYAASDWQGFTTGSWDSQSWGYNRCGIKQAAQTVTKQSESGIRLHPRNKESALISLYTTWGFSVILEHIVQFTMFESKFRWITLDCVTAPAANSCVIGIC